MRRMFSHDAHVGTVHQRIPIEIEPVVDGDWIGAARGMVAHGGEVGPVDQRVLS